MKIKGSGTSQRTKKEKAEENESEGNTNYSWCTLNIPQEIGEGTGGVGNQWKNRNHPTRKVQTTQVSAEQK